MKINTDLKDNLENRLLWFAEQSPRMQIINTGSLVYIDSGRSSAAMNVVWGASDSMENTREVTKYYAFQQTPATWWLPADIKTPTAWWLAGEGWVLEEVLIGMVMTGESRYYKDGGPGLEIKSYLNQIDVACLGAIWDSISDEGSIWTHLGIVDACLLEKPPVQVKGVRNYRTIIGYAEGQPVVSVGLLKKDRQVGIYDLTVHPRYRGRGYVLPLLRQAVGEALKDGCDLITLLAASQGINFCAELGFTPVNQFVVWNNKATF